MQIAHKMVSKKLKIVSKMDDQNNFRRGELLRDKRED